VGDVGIICVIEYDSKGQRGCGARLSIHQWAS
jgi:hypothetical protein